MRRHTKNWGFLGGRLRSKCHCLSQKGLIMHLGTDDFDRPEAAESKHDSKDDSNGLKSNG